MAMLQGKMRARTAAGGAVRVFAVARPAVTGTRRVAAGASASAAVLTAPTVHALTPSTFDGFLAAHPEKLVIVDFYTDWCGPCKMMAPELERMAARADPERVLFTKINCGVDNEAKRLAMAHGIKALPTFKLFRNGQVADQMTGAKAKALADLIEKNVNA